MLGCLTPQTNSGQQAIHESDNRRFRLTLGPNTFVSKEYGIFKSETELAFYEPYSFYYDNHSRMINIEIFR